LLQWGVGWRRRTIPTPAHRLRPHDPGDTLAASPCSDPPRLRRLRVLLGWCARTSSPHSAQAPHREHRKGRSRSCVASPSRGAENGPNGTAVRCFFRTLGGGPGSGPVRADVCCATLPRIALLGPRSGWTQMRAGHGHRRRHLERPTARCRPGPQATRLWRSATALAAGLAWARQRPFRGRARCCRRWLGCAFVCHD
jgi:hypothetical protein